MKRYILSVLIVIAVFLFASCDVAEDLPVPPVDVPKPYAAGSINITDTETMEVRGMYVNGQTIEVPSDAARELAELFNGRELTGGEFPACACDLSIQTDAWQLSIHTDCGSVIAHADGIDGYTELTVEEIEELSDILDVYDHRTELTDE